MSNKERRTERTKNAESHRTTRTLPNRERLNGAEGLTGDAGFPLLDLVVSPRGFVRFVAHPDARPRPAAGYTLGHPLSSTRSQRRIASGSFGLRRLFAPLLSSFRSRVRSAPGFVPLPGSFRSRVQRSAVDRSIPSFCVQRSTFRSSFFVLSSSFAPVFPRRVCLPLTSLP